MMNRGPATIIHSVGGVAAVGNTQYIGPLVTKCTVGCAACVGHKISISLGA